MACRTLRQPPALDRPTLSSHSPPLDRGARRRRHPQPAARPPPRSSPTMPPSATRKVLRAFSHAKACGGNGGANKRTSCRAFRNSDGQGSGHARRASCKPALGRCLRCSSSGRALGPAPGAAPLPRPPATRPQPVCAAHLRPRRPAELPAPDAPVLLHDSARICKLCRDLSWSCRAWRRCCDRGEER